MYFFKSLSDYRKHTSPDQSGCPFLLHQRCKMRVFSIERVVTVREEFEDTKAVIRIRIIHCLNANILQLHEKWVIPLLFQQGTFIKSRS
jgi:hypothetical protein